MKPDFVALAVPGVRELQPYQPGKPVEELERELGIADIVKLASNENPLGPSPTVAGALAAAAPSLARYPDGSGHRLRHRLAAELNVDVDCITLGNGSNDVLELVVRTFAAAGDEVVYSAHAFAVYPLVTRAVGALGVEVPARDWGHDLSAMAAAVNARTRVIFIANPNNPTGTWSTADEVRGLLEAVPGHVIVVVDEAYFEYVTEAGYPDCVRWIDEFPNLVVTRTFSKAYGLAALRLGYAISRPQIADLLNRVRQPFNVNHLAQVAGLAALDDPAHVERSRAVNREGMDLLQKGLRELGLGWIPSVANFISVDTGRDAEPVFRGLLQRGVIVRPIGGYAMPTHVRVTVGTREENQRFLGALAAVMEAR